MPEAPRPTTGKGPGGVDPLRTLPDLTNGVEDPTASADTTSPNEHVFVTRIELAGLSDEAKRACGRFIERFGVELAGEASRIEESSRPLDVEHPEITAATISSAYSGIMQRQVIAATGGIRTISKSWKERGIEITATLGMAAAGAFAGYLHAKWQVALFTVLAVLGILSTLYVIGRQK